MSQLQQSQSQSQQPQPQQAQQPQAQQPQAQAQDDGEQINFTDEFKNAVRDYCEKDDQRLKLKKDLKDLNGEINDLEDTIVSFMKDNNLPVFDTGGKGLFKNKVEKKQKGLSKQIIIDALSKCTHLKDPTKAAEVAEFIYKSRPSEEKQTLQRK